MPDLLERYARVQEEIAAACARAGRRRSDVLLLAVSKFQPVEAVAAMAAAGQTDFGENYVQEALAKREALANTDAGPNIAWHMIGHVQMRKAGQIAGSFALMHTLDSIRLADALERRLEQDNCRQACLIEVNIAAEPQKAGTMPENLAELAEHVAKNCPAIDLRGLMCLPPVFDSGEAARPYFARLRQLRDDLSLKLGRELPHLSMGMSGDFGAAIEEGATIVRIGTGIFGPRPTHAQG